VRESSSRLSCTQLEDVLCPLEGDLSSVGGFARLHPHKWPALKEREFSYNLVTSETELQNRVAADLIRPVFGRPATGTHRLHVMGDCWYLLRPRIMGAETLEDYCRRTYPDALPKERCEGGDIWLPDPDWDRDFVERFVAAFACQLILGGGSKFSVARNTDVRNEIYPTHDSDAFCSMFEPGRPSKEVYLFNSTLFNWQACRFVNRIGEGVLAEVLRRWRAIPNLAETLNQILIMKVGFDFKNTVKRVNYIVGNLKAIERQWNILFYGNSERWLNPGKNRMACPGCDCQHYPNCGFEVTRATAVTERVACSTCIDVDHENHLAAYRPAMEVDPPLSPSFGPSSPSYDPLSPSYSPISSPQRDDYSPTSPVYVPGSPSSPSFNPVSPSSSPISSPLSDDYSPTSPAYAPGSPSFAPMPPRLPKRPPSEPRPIDLESPARRRIEFEVEPGRWLLTREELRVRMNQFTYRGGESAKAVKGSLQKACRRGDVQAAQYWAAVMMCSQQMDHLTYLLTQIATEEISIADHLVVEAAYDFRIRYLFRRHSLELQYQRERRQAPRGAVLVVPHRALANDEEFRTSIHVLCAQLARAPKCRIAYHAALTMEERSITSFGVQGLFEAFRANLESGHPNTVRLMGLAQTILFESPLIRENINKLFGILHDYHIVHAGRHPSADGHNMIRRLQSGLYGAHISRSGNIEKGGRAYLAHAILLVMHPRPAEARLPQVPLSTREEIRRLYASVLDGSAGFRTDYDILPNGPNYDYLIRANEERNPKSECDDAYLERALAKAQK
jgi:hypothetical protein